MAKTRTPPQFTVTPPPAPPKPDGQQSPPAVVGQPAKVMTDWVQSDIAAKESQPQVISDGGKGVSN